MIYSPHTMTWRNAYNPLVGLTLTRVVTLLNSAEQGYYADLTWLYRFVEKRDATLRAVKRRRLAAIKKLNWSIKIREGFEDDKKAKKQQKALQEAYERIDNLKEAYGWLAYAEFRGFAHLEKHVGKKGIVTHLQPVPQWFWARNFKSLEWLYNETASQRNSGKVIDPSLFIIRETDDPIDEIGLIAFIRKNLSQKDWDGFIETYGIPPLFVELPTGQGTNDAYQELVEKVIGDGRGVLPGGAKMVNLDIGSRGSSPFDQHIRYQDEQIVMAATSGILTALNDATGLGSGQTDAHERAFNDLAAAEAMEISELFQKQFDEPILEKLGDEQTLAYFELAYQEVASGETVIKDAATLAQAGYDIELEQLQERTGYKLSKRPQPGMGGGGFGGDLGGGFGEDIGGELGGGEYGTEEDLSGDLGLSEEVENALRGSGPELLANLKRMDQRLPVLLRKKNRYRMVIKG